MDSAMSVQVPFASWFAWGASGQLRELGRVIPACFPLRDTTASHVTCISIYSHEVSLCRDGVSIRSVRALCAQIAAQELCNRRGVEERQIIMQLQTVCARLPTPARDVENALKDCGADLSNGRAAGGNCTGIDVNEVCPALRQC